MEERLQKLLSAAGVCSRRASENYILAGRVTIDGIPAQLGQRADPERNDIRVDGRPLTVRPSMVYLMLNKPRGYVTTLSDEQGAQRLPSWWRMPAPGFIPWAAWIWILRGCCC